MFVVRQRLKPRHRNEHSNTATQQHPRSMGECSVPVTERSPDRNFVTGTLLLHTIDPEVRTKPVTRSAVRA
jgi:hypothetical protein